MSLGLPPLNWLRAFEAAARTLSFTGAAQELNITQSAVSQQIKALEGHLGQPLFHRRQRALELTRTGLLYLPVVRDAFRTLSRGTRAVLGPERHVLQVQCNITFAIHWLAPRIARFQARHPEIRLNLRTELWEPRDMAEGADLEIRYSLRPAEHLRARLLRRDHYYPVTAPNYAVALSDLHTHSLWDCANLMCNWPSWAEDQNLQWPNPHVTYATTYSVTMAVAAAGAGIALAHDTIAHTHLAKGSLVAPFDHRVAMEEAYYLVSAPHAADMPSATAFTTWLLEELEP
ncbi:LysR substrate-binding domain-containing protein [Shimia abyssi]|uniref:LysR family glycine cleavage system transcriptional activator n=1 Tax=Shimia abyssi TaxID=1662395 RepID=A0A2P8F9J5_9RHOB|nr:LysR substrate-binding domain-containing protein [Shimia abyssi]PSL18368.1 LysR family glycine cleavage system transcriptional activator [Shimia abyssi]